MSWLFCLLMLRGWVFEAKRRFQVCLLWIVVGGCVVCVVLIPLCFVELVV